MITGKMIGEEAIGRVEVGRAYLQANSYHSCFQLAMSSPPPSSSLPFGPEERISILTHTSAELGKETHVDHVAPG